MAEDVYGFDGQGVRDIRDTVNAVLGMPVDGMGKKRGHRVPGVGGKSSSYSGPWAVVRKDDTTATVKALDIANGYYCKSLIIAGLTTKEHTADSDVSVSASGIVYADITVSGGTYSVTFSIDTNLPSQTTAHYYVALAHVLYEDSKISSVTQLQYGNIHIAGRVV